MPALKFMWPWLALLLAFLFPMWLMAKRQSKGSVIHSHLALVIKKLGANKKSGTKDFVFFATCFCLLVLSVMRPAWVKNPIEISRAGRSIMIVLDISESMEVKDMTLGGRPEDRLTIAKAILNDFITARKNDRLGLVVFGSEAFLHSPLTFDHDTLRRFLGESEIGFMGPKTAFGDALLLATKTLLEESGDKLVISLTDGQTNAGHVEPGPAAEIAKQHGIKYFVVGMGADRMQVQGFFGTNTVNPSSDLDEAEPTLKKIALLTGGQYFRAHDSNALKASYQKIDEMVPHSADPEIITPSKELFFWPLLLALSLLLIRRLWFFTMVKRNA